jgi:hypothetical protein
MEERKMQAELAMAQQKLDAELKMAQQKMLLDHQIKKQEAEFKAAQAVAMQNQQAQQGPKPGADQ